MATNYRQSVYEPRLKAGLEYQDFIMSQLAQHGWYLTNFQSYRYQCEKGENTFGLEIKFDDRYQSTGNLWIEVAEKADPANLAYVPSGLYRDDNSWLYGIGNYAEFLVFTKQRLMIYRRSARVQIIENTTRTSKGFLLPQKAARSLAVKRFEFGPEVQPELFRVR